MTHRDELLALRARLEAQARELDETKADNELLRAANSQKTREIERLKGELEATQRDATHDPWSDHTSEPPDVAGSVSRARAAAREGNELRRPFAVAAVAMAATALLGAFVVALGAPQRPRARSSEVSLASRVGTVRLGTVVAGDPAVAAEGSTCAVSVSPVDGGGRYDCRVEVRCGDRALYGATPDTGYVRCGDREILRDSLFTARDGDPAMELDLVTDRLVVEEQLGLGTQRVEIALTPTRTHTR